MWEKNVEALNAMISHTFDLAQALIKPVEPGFLVMRLKALVSLKDVAEKIVVQGVYDLFDRHVGGVWEAGEERESRVVLIGEGLDERLLRESFEAWCLVDEE
jgi:G3E family GTPase